MNDEGPEINSVRRQLRNAIAPVQDDSLNIDLWPRMLQRIERAPARFGWFDALVAGMTAAACGVLPEIIPMMFWHL